MKYNVARNIDLVGNINFQGCDIILRVASFQLSSESINFALKYEVAGTVTALYRIPIFNTLFSKADIPLQSSSLCLFKAAGLGRFLF